MSSYVLAMVVVLVVVVMVAVAVAVVAERPLERTVQLLVESLCWIFVKRQVLFKIHQQIFSCSTYSARFASASAGFGGLPMVIGAPELLCNEDSLENVEENKQDAKPFCIKRC